MNSKEENIIKKIEMVFEKLGWTLVSVNEVKNYELNGEYVRVSPVKELNSYVIETAFSIEEANNNMYEDSSLFWADQNEEDIIKQATEDIRKYYS